MSKPISWRTFWMAFFVIVAGLQSSVFAHHESDYAAYDPNRSVCVMDYQGKVREEGKGWEALNYLYFDNGVYGISRTFWGHYDQALHAAETPYLGRKGNIVQDGPSEGERHHFAFKSDETLLMPMDFYVNRAFHFERLPYIVSITEHEENIHHWLSKDGHKYRYTIELSDGSVWLHEQTEKWENMWHVGTVIILVGTTHHPIFINKHRVLDKDFPIIGRGDSLIGLEQLR